ncbi:MAG: hypothetical protein PHO02_06415 [Candidatus Nanoarchaeia archaeon]|nr:hypothetical protein [Candidatus Nanoarchaeia archaeon]
MKKKGIAPIIAFVMLMALAVTLGAFVTIWYTKSTESQTKTMIEKFGNVDECADVRFDVEFNYTTCKNITVYNLGNFNIDKIKLELILMDGTPFSEVFDYLILPKENVEISIDLRDVQKFQFAPIIAEGTAVTMCLNDRVFVPDKIKCPPLTPP